MILMYQWLRSLHAATSHSFHTEARWWEVNGKRGNATVQERRLRGAQ